MNPRDDGGFPHILPRRRKHFPNAALTKHGNESIFLFPIL